MELYMYIYTLLYRLTLLICTIAKILLGDWVSISALTCSRVSAGGQDGYSDWGKPEQAPH